MKKLAALRYRKQYLVALLLCVIALVLYHSRETKFLLYDICPAIATGKYSATLVWDGQASGEIHKVPIPDGEFWKLRLSYVSTPPKNSTGCCCSLVFAQPLQVS